MKRGRALSSTQSQQSATTGYPIKTDDNVELGATSNFAETCYIEAGQENAKLQIWGYKYSLSKRIISWVLSVLSLGFLRLFFFWKPDWLISFTCYGCKLRDADVILIQDENFQSYLCEVKYLNRNSGLSLFLSGGESCTLTFVRFFNHRKLFYVWYEQYGKFKRLMNPDHKILCGDFHKFKPLDSQESERRLSVYGPNEIVVKLKPIMNLILLEALNPFYVFQLFSISVWFSDNYYYYASVIIIMSCLSIFADVFQIRKNQCALRDTISSSDSVTVVRRRPRDRSFSGTSETGQSPTDLFALGQWAEKQAEIRTPTLIRHSRSQSDAITVPSTQLVPGDVIIIPSHGCIMQCDAVLLTGNCIVNESMLTGESVPVTKTPIPKPETQEGSCIYDDNHHGKHTLYNGTKVLQTRYYSGQSVKAVVLRTGYNTMKGQLVRSIMYPKPVDFEFTKDLLRFVCVLAGIATIGFFYTIILMSSSGIGIGKIFVRALDIITIVVPPALPAAMTIGVIAAEQRLKRRNIYCISPTTINTCGGLNVVCFDKTGTLTEEGLDFLGVLECKNQSLSGEVFSISQLGNEHPLTQCMASCHSLTCIEQQLTGDPLDLVLFRETGWQLEEPDLVEEIDRYDMLAPTVVRPADSQILPPESASGIGDHTAGLDLSFDKNNDNKDADNESCSSAPPISGPLKPLEIGILRQLQFSSTLQRMSVVTRIFGAPKLTLFCKGAPETVASLCDPASLPADFTGLLQQYTQKGYRVIAAAWRSLNMNYVKSQRASRDQLEKDLNFLGLIVLENRLKSQTTPVITQLKRAQIRSVMVTGDNVLTAISVGRECGILSANRRLYVIELEEQQAVNSKKVARTNDADNVLESGNVEHDLNESDEDYCIQPPVIKIRRDSISETKHSTYNGSGAGFVNPSPNFPDVMSPLLQNVNHRQEISSIHHDITSHIHNNGSLATKCINDSSIGYQLAITGTSFALLVKHYPHLLPKLVVVCDIFARMAPEQKAQLVHCLQELNYVVAMCGDGANDCGALKAAHAGISLSEAEASIASPFTSKTPDIRCVLDVIREGRAALVTSFGIFKYMAGYSMTQFISVSILYWIGTNLADFQFLYIDLCLITVFALFFGYTPAADFIDTKPPPTKILSVSSIASICTQLLLSALFQIFTFKWIAQQPWFIPFVDPGNEQNFQSFQSTAVFLTSLNQYITLAIVYSKSYPYRKSLFSNRLLFSALLICASLNATIILAPPSLVANWLDLKLFPTFHYRLLTLFLAALNFLLGIFTEKFFIEGLMQKYLARKAWRNNGQEPKYAQILGSIGTSLSWLHSATPFTTNNGKSEEASHKISSLCVQNVSLTNENACTLNNLPGRNATKQTVYYSRSGVGTENAEFEADKNVEIF